MSKYELTGTIKTIGETQIFASGFTKRVLVVTDDDPKYPQDIPMEVVKDKCDTLDQYQPGERVTVSFNLRGNEHNGRHYLSLAAWKIERDSPAQPKNERPPARSTSQNGARPPAQVAEYEDEENQIPF